MKDDPEYTDYYYTPNPWPEDRSFPNGEVWHFLNHPEYCGTSTETKDMLPVRLKGPIGSRTQAFGMYLNEEYSLLVITLPTILLSLLLMIPSGWFMGFWLDEHPNDLQNASIPMHIVSSLLNLFINIPLTLLLFRWSRSS